MDKTGKNKFTLNDFVKRKGVDNIIAVGYKN